MTAMAGSGAPANLRGTAARRRNEGLVRAVLLAASILSIFISLAIVLTLVFEALSFLSQIQLSQLFAPGWFPRRGMFSIPTVLAGTFIITVIAMVIADPARSGQRDLPVRIQQPADSQGRQADPRDPGRASRASCSASSL